VGLVSLCLYVFSFLLLLGSMMGYAMVLREKGCHSSGTASRHLFVSLALQQASTIVSRASTKRIMCSHSESFNGTHWRGSEDIACRPHISVCCTGQRWRAKHHGQDEGIHPWVRPAFWPDSASLVAIIMSGCPIAADCRVVYLQVRLLKQRLIPSKSPIISYWGALRCKFV